MRRLRVQPESLIRALLPYPDSLNALLSVPNHSLVSRATRQPRPCTVFATSDFAPVHVRCLVFLDVARPRSDARPDFKSVRAKRASWEAIPRRGVP
eukprot:7888546-Pyramimonas_sp.AAC.1